MVSFFEDEWIGLYAMWVLIFTFMLFIQVRLVCVGDIWFGFIKLPLI